MSTNIKNINISKVLTIVAVIGVLSSMWYGSLRTQQLTAQAHEPTPAELASQAQSASESLANEAKIQGIKAQAYSLLDQADKLASSSSSSDPKVQR
jgi:hypothetical protein